MHDYEFAVTQHRIACRLATRVIFPDSVPAERLRRFGVGPEKLFQYPGLKEEYYLADFEPDPGVLERLGVDTRRVVVDRQAAARRLAVPPQVESALRRRSSPTSEPTPRSTPSSCPAPTPSEATWRASICRR